MQLHNSEVASSGKIFNKTERAYIFDTCKQLRRARQSVRRTIKQDSLSESLADLRNMLHAREQSSNLSCCQTRVGKNYVVNCTMHACQSAGPLNVGTSEIPSHCRIWSTSIHIPDAYQPEMKPVKRASNNSSEGHGVRFCHLKVSPT